jgi:hydrogenase expression/formation protein HypC
MCLAVPGRITEIDGTTAQIDFGGVTREASLVLVPDASVGSFVLVHAGFAIETLKEEEAAETLSLFRELARALDEDDSGSAPSHDADPAPSHESDRTTGEGAGKDDSGGAT